MSSTLKSSHSSHAASVLGRVFMTGVTSIHGWPIFQALRSVLEPGMLYGVRPPKTVEPQSADVEPLCLTDESRLRRILDEFRPDTVIHAGGVCDLDVCEERPEWAQELNVAGSRAVASVFGGGCRVLFVSTDLVYSGLTTPEGGYRESDTPDPISVVGKTFLEAEREITALDGASIFRVGLPIGASIQGEKGAIDWIEGRFRRGRPATLFYDEHRSCIGCRELAEVVLEAVVAGCEGLYHLGGPRPVSLFEIGERVLPRGPYDAALLKGRYRHEEVDGPPRVGNLHLNSAKLERLVGREFGECDWGA